MTKVLSPAEPLAGRRGIPSRGVLAAFVAVVILAPLVLRPFQVSLLDYIALYALVALGLVLLTGIGGLTSFGQAAFVGVGAYATAVVTTSQNLPAWLAWAPATTLRPPFGPVTVSSPGLRLPTRKRAEVYSRLPLRPRAETTRWLAPPFKAPAPRRARHPPPAIPAPAPAAGCGASRSCRRPAGSRPALPLAPAPG